MVVNVGCGASRVQTESVGWRTECHEVDCDTGLLL